MGAPAPFGASLTWPSLDLFRDGVAGGRQRASRRPRTGEMHEHRLLGRQQAIYDERDRKLAEARERRQANRQAAQTREVA